MAAIALPPCVTRSLAAMILAMWNRLALVFQKEGFVPSEKIARKELSHYAI